MDKQEKNELLATLKGVFADSGAVIVAHYSGMTVAEMSKLRAKVREAGGQAKVVKNRVARIALDGRGGTEASDMFKGPTVIVFSPDAVGAAKVAVEFAKSNEKYALLGGVMGTRALNTDAVKALATLPSLDQLRGQIIGLLQAPATKVAGVLQAPAGQLARVFAAYADKGKEAA
jgi:large subunit ribosomal protein L10